MYPGSDSLEMASVSPEELEEVTNSCWRLRRVFLFRIVPPGVRPGAVKIERIGAVIRNFFWAKTDFLYKNRCQLLASFYIKFII